MLAMRREIGRRVQAGPVRVRQAAAGAQVLLGRGVIFLAALRAFQFNDIRRRAHKPESLAHPFWPTPRAHRGIPAPKNAANSRYNKELAVRLFPLTIDATLLPSQ